MAEIADRISNVRKEAEQLKELIKQKRDALADTTRKALLLFLSFLEIWDKQAPLFYWVHPFPQMTEWECMC